jgi:hypothetical protein
VPTLSMEGQTMMLPPWLIEELEKSRRVREERERPRVEIVAPPPPEPKPDPVPEPRVVILDL